MTRLWRVAALLAATCMTCSGFSPSVLLLGGRGAGGETAARSAGLVRGAARGRAAACPPLRLKKTVKEESSKDWNKYIREGMEQPMSSKRQPEGPLEDDPSLPMVEDLIVACDERKAENIWAARVAHLTYTTSFFVNCEGTSRPMLQAIAANVEDTMRDKHQREIKWQGNPDSGWILLDYGEVIVNIMTESAREFYDLESMWKNGEKIPLGHLVKPNEGSTVAVAIEDDDWGADDPFDKWDTWDEGQDLSPEEKKLLEAEGKEDDEDDEM